MGKVRGFFITGTDTGVGKTQVTGGIAAVLNSRLRAAGGADASAAGHSSAASLPAAVRLWKPVQTGTVVGDQDADSFRLRALSELAQAETAIAGLTLPEPLAPWMSAERAGVRLEYGEIVADGRRRLAEPGVCLVEGAGGLAVPLTSEALMADLAADLGLPLLIVARPGLGTVNHTLQTIGLARQKGIRIAGFILNGEAPEDSRDVGENRRMIEHFSGVACLGRLPWLPEPSVRHADWKPWRDQWVSAVERELAWDLMLDETLNGSEAGAATGR